MSIPRITQILETLFNSVSSYVKVGNATHDNLNCNANLQKNNTDVSSANAVDVSDANMFNYSFATGKSKVLNGAGTLTPAASTTFYVIDFHNDSFISAMTVDSGWADYTGVTMLRGTRIITNCTSITLTSGLLTAYQRST